MNRGNAFNIIYPSLFLVVLMIIPLVKYSDIASYSLSAPIITFAGIVIYTILWFFLKPDRFSWISGLIIGFLFILTIFLEDFINWPTQTFSLVSTLTMMFLIFVSFSIISALRPAEDYTFLKGVKASFISAIPGTVIALSFGFLICYLFSGRLVEILRNDPGYTDFSNPIAYIFFNAFDNASNHVIIVPVVSIIMGSIGAAVKLLILKLRKAKPVAQ